jgi:hypothetical protein
MFNAAWADVSASVRLDSRSRELKALENANTAIPKITSVRTIDKINSTRVNPAEDRVRAATVVAKLYCF